MKKIFYSLAIVSIGMIATAKAQVSIGVSIGAPVYAAPMAAAPGWMPAGPASPYYYFPDINCYYDMSLGQYIYFENSRWIYASMLPPRFRGYDFGRGRIMPMSRGAFGYRGIPAYGGGPRMMPGGPRGGMMMRPGGNLAMRGGGPQMMRGGTDGPRMMPGGGNRGGNFNGGRGNYGGNRGGMHDGGRR